MKKYFIFAFAALTSVVMFSCKEKPGGGGETPVDPTTNGKVVLSAHELEITVGAQEKLRASVTPVKEGVAISYKSDDETIATVDASGLVTAVESGKANIIASAEGYTSDTCVVTVISIYDSFAWGGMGLFDLGTEPLGEPYTWISPYNGKEYLLQNFEGTYYLWSSDIVFTNGVGFNGVGYMADVTCPVAIIQNGSPNGTPGNYMGADLTFDNSFPADSMGAVAEGSLTDPAKWGAWLMDSTYTGDNSFTGVRIDIIDFEAQTQEDDESLPFVGFIKNGWIGEYSNGLFYQMNITWFDLNQGLYGLKMEQNADGRWQFVQPYEFTDFIPVYYEEMPAQQEEVARPLKLMTIGNQRQVEMLSAKRSSRANNLEKFRMAR